MSDDGNELLFGVARSFTGKSWRQRPGDDRLGLAVAQRLGLPEIVGRLLVTRGVALDDADDFLEPKLARLLPDPAHLKDMDAAVSRLVRAVETGERIAVFGDYDVDGATSAALLTRYFRCLGMELDIYIPDRLAEGYGPNAPALQGLARAGASVVITVDCGITAFEPLTAAKASGLDVVVVDHHLAEPRLPEAAAVINPNRLDDDSECKQLAAVGVAFLLVVGLNRALRDAGFFSPVRPEPDLRQWLDLVALGTVADVVPLTGVNRAFVVAGLKVLARRGNAGLAALADVAGIDEAPGTFHLGFILGPRVNAGGRVGDAALGARLLATDDTIEATRLAARLDGFNRERREIEAAVLAQAVAQVEAQGEAQGETTERPGACVFVQGAGWHPGVIGIVASRLVERFAAPAIVASVDGERAVASARSVRGIDFGAAVTAARQRGLLVAGGGHAMAAGITVKLERLEETRQFLEEHLARQGAAAGAAPVLHLDGALAPAAATLDFVEILDRLQPFGSGNAEPRFAFSDMAVRHADVVGQDHVRCRLGAPGGGTLQGIAFRAAEGALGQGLLRHGGAPVHMAGRLRANTWMGKTSVQLLIDDAAPGN